MQRLGQLTLCLSLLLAALANVGPALVEAGPLLRRLPTDASEALLTAQVTSMSDAARLVPLALVLVLAALIMLCTPSGSGQDKGG